jgi:drug/metabolite transporter (DMT)-like permease
VLPEAAPAVFSTSSASPTRGEPTSPRAPAEGRHVTYLDQRPALSGPHPSRAGPSRAAPSRANVALYTVIALLGFAGNSLLTRHALDTQAIDAVSFTSIRLIAGALTLILLAGAHARAEAGTGAGARGGALATLRDGSLGSAIALAGYALGFTFAYEHIPAGVGALLLFGSVQVTMVCWGLRHGERPRGLDWLGLALAMGGLWYLTWPGVTAPDPLGSLLMIVAGVGWGLYSVRGRDATRPLAATAGNFARTVPIAIVAWASMLMLGHAHLSARGVLLAIVSGSLTSGIAYSLWYAALPGLATWTAAIVQLCVPMVTAIAATWLLGESLGTRLLVSGGLILGGVLLATVPRRPQRPVRPAAQDRH